MVETSHAMPVLRQNRSNPCFLRESLISLQLVALIFIKVMQKFVSNRLGNVLWSTSSWIWAGTLAATIISTGVHKIFKFLEYRGIFELGLKYQVSHLSMCFSQLQFFTITISISEKNFFVNIIKQGFIKLDLKQKKDEMINEKDIENNGK